MSISLKGSVAFGRANPIVLTSILCLGKIDAKLDKDG